MQMPKSLIKLTGGGGGNGNFTDPNKANIEVKKYSMYQHKTATHIYIWLKHRGGGLHSLLATHLLLDQRVEDVCVDSNGAVVEVLKLSETLLLLNRPHQRLREQLLVSVLLFAVILLGVLLTVILAV
jgi:hypothetical protein